MIMEVDSWQFFFCSCVLAFSFIVLSKFFSWLVSFYYIRKNLREQWKGPPCHWFFGHVRMITGADEDPRAIFRYFAEKQKEFPYGFALYMGPFRALLRVHHPSIVKEILHSSAFDVPKSKMMRQSFAPWIGSGVAIEEGGEWIRLRRLLTYSFHFDILKHYLFHMNSCTDTLLGKWNSLLKSKEQARIEIFSEASLMTLDAILQCLVSYQSNCQLEKGKNPFIACVYALTKYISMRFRSKNPLNAFNFFYFRSKNGKKFLKHCDDAHEISDAFIRKRREEMVKGTLDENRKLDFLDTLLQAKDSDGTGLTDFEIRSQLDSFLFGGHDTTASAISWILYNLATHPEFQERCAVEVDAVMGDKTDVAWSHLSSFSFLTRCIKESLRLNPPIPLVSRTLKKDISVEGKTILKGTVVLIGILEMQKSEEFWKNPDEFNPDRFTLENAVEQNHNAYIPFSAGPRNCIGQNFAMHELKVVIAKLLRNFRFTLDTEHEIIPCRELVYRTKTGLYLYIEPRN